MLIGIILKSKPSKVRLHLKNKLRNYLIEISNNILVGSVNVRIKKHILDIIKYKKQNAIVFYDVNNYNGFNVDIIGGCSKIININDNIFSRLK